MPTKKKSPVSEPAITLPKELLEQLIPGPMSAESLEAVFRNFKKAFIERALGAELDVHLDGPEGGGNHRNGRSGKTVLTDDGPVRVEVPRDRAGTFEPQLNPSTNAGSRASMTRSSRCTPVACPSAKSRAIWPRCTP